MPIHNSFFFDPATGQPSGLHLQQNGPILIVEISLHPFLVSRLQQQGQPVPSPIQGVGLIDTGAAITAVDAAQLQQLNIPPVGSVQVLGATGTQNQNLYPVRIQFPQTPFPGLAFNFVLGANLAGQNIIALIGRDVLRTFLFTYNGQIGQFILAL